MTERLSGCAVCGGKCCRQPLMLDSEIRRMISVVGNPAVARAGLKKEAPGWHRIVGECPALTDRGCLMVESERPITCQLYPFQFILMPGGGYRLLLDLNICPQWREFGADYTQALGWFQTYMRREASANPALEGNPS